MLHPLSQSIADVVVPLATSNMPNGHGYATHPVLGRIQDMDVSHFVDGRQATEERRPPSRIPQPDRLYRMELTELSVDFPTRCIEPRSRLRLGLRRLPNHNGRKVRALA